MMTSSPVLAQFANVATERAGKAEEHPLAASKWTDLPSAIAHRYEAQSAVVDGKLYVFSGFTEHVWPVIYITDTTEMYDPESRQWSLQAPMPIPVTHAAAAVAGESVWIVGGFIGDHPGEATDQTQIYNTQHDVWTAGPPLPAARASGALVRLGRHLHYFGGLLPDRDTDVGDHYVLDMDEVDLGWSTAAPLPVPRNHLGAAAVAGRIYALGGQQGHDIRRTLLAYVHAYDPVTDSWERRADLSAARSHFEPGTFVVGGRILIAGGVAAGARNRPSTDLLTSYDPFTDTWSMLEPLPEKLLAPVAKSIGSELLVTHGGREGGVYPENRAWSRSIAGMQRDTVGFWPEQIHLEARVGDVIHRDILLWDTSGNGKYFITFDEASWIRTVTPDPISGSVEGSLFRLVIDASGLEPGTHTARGRAVDQDSVDAVFEVSLHIAGVGTSVEANAHRSPLVLGSAFPNPFTEETFLRVWSPGSEPIRVTLFSILGQQVDTPAANPLSSDSAHILRISASGLPNGMYVVVVRSGSSRASRRVILAR